jgi:pyridoxal phosphate enzyme (YggS family)
VPDEDRVSSPIAARLAAVQARIAEAASRAGRPADAVTLVGVTKRHPAPAVAEAIRAGLTCCGESFAQEARDKLPEVARVLGPEVPPPRWHFVGRLQRNKARLVATSFDCVESVDRVSLATELDRRAGEAGRRLEVLIQVNLSGEAQKGGVEPAELPALLDAAAGLVHLRVSGLMTVPAAAGGPEAARPVFAGLRQLRERLAAEGHSELVDLSMGMSADFEVAIEEGATLVRVGTAIFGPREPTTPGGTT